MKGIHGAGIGLVLIEVALAKALVELAQEIVGVQPVAVVGNETDRTLVGAGQIENRHAGAFLERRAELVESVTVASLQCAPLLFLSKVSNR